MLKFFQIEGRFPRHPGELPSVAGSTDISVAAGLRGVGRELVTKLLNPKTDLVLDSAWRPTQFVQAARRQPDCTTGHGRRAYPARSNPR